MRSVFVNSGLFVWHPMWDGYIAQRGDVYLNETSHTAMCISAVPDMLAEFNINEFGGITGGSTGDQTGSESRIAPYYDFPWDGILQYNGAADGTTTEPSQPEEEDSNMDEKVNAIYNQVFSTNDPTGRGVLMNDHDHIKWIAAKEEYIVECLTVIADALNVKLPKFE